MKKFRSHAIWLAAGIALLLFVKYGVLGLTLWDKLLHPQRVEPPSSPFLEPFLGLFSS